MSNELRIDAVLKSIDVYGRLAFGGQCVAAMAMLAAPLLLITASIVPFAIWGDDHGEAILVWLGGWGLAIGVGAAGVALGVFCWRWSGDWITEWPGYAVASDSPSSRTPRSPTCSRRRRSPYPRRSPSPWPRRSSPASLVAGHLGGMRVLPEQREERQRALARRR